MHDDQLLRGSVDTGIKFSSMRSQSFCFSQNVENRTGDVVNYKINPRSPNEKFHNFGGKIDSFCTFHNSNYIEEEIEIDSRLLGNDVWDDDRSCLDPDSFDCFGEETEFLGSGESEEIESGEYDFGERYPKILETEFDNYELSISSGAKNKDLTDISNNSEFGLKGNFKIKNKKNYSGIGVSNLSLDFHNDTEVEGFISQIRKNPIYTDKEKKLLAKVLKEKQIKTKYGDKQKQKEFEVKNYFVTPVKNSQKKFKKNLFKDHDETHTPDSLSWDLKSQNTGSIIPSRKVEKIQKNEKTGEFTEISEKYFNSINSVMKSLGYDISQTHSTQEAGDIITKLQKKYKKSREEIEEMMVRKAASKLGINLDSILKRKGVVEEKGMEESHESTFKLADLPTPSPPPEKVPRFTNFIKKKTKPPVMSTKRENRSNVKLNTNRSSYDKENRNSKRMPIKFKLSSDKILELTNKVCIEI